MKNNLKNNMTGLILYVEKINKTTAIGLGIILLVPFLLMSFCFIKLILSNNSQNIEISKMEEKENVLNAKIEEYESILKSKNEYLENKKIELSKTKDEKSVELITALITDTEKSIEIINNIISENK